MKHNIAIIITCATLISVVFFLHDSIYFKWLVVGVILLFLSIVALGTSFIQLNYFVESINKGNNKGIALTFDDGPNAAITPQILAILEKENIKATFFIIGNKIEQNAALLKKIDNEGHTIGNHSYSHNNLTTIYSTKKLKDDLIKCNQLINQVIAKKPLFFRPPFGVTTPRYKRALKQLNMQSIGWTIRSLDTQSKNKELLYKKITKQISDGSIILFHDTQQITLDVLPDIIQFCKINGINIVPLHQLTNHQPYA
ncbi:MAG: polysaccharide deacetylase [Flavobacteriales bacterium CG18_big_fil_WC_8_21_14_2_50_32_9]|nr:MAG: polysaccharide deacetylase [Flavobacteriales bacterium CG18_big_fil_WC_8_21_14_2_50_32_9]